MDQLLNASGFDWDEGNSEKNWIRHRVSRLECEQPFFNEPLLVVKDDEHSQHEDRYFALGPTDGGRRLFLVFTIRDNLVRMISARDMSKEEREVYASAEE